MRIIPIFFGVVFILMVYCCNFTLFPKTEKLLSSIEINGIEFRAYHVALGATTSDVIQIRKINKNNNENEETIKIYENYNEAKLEMNEEGYLIVILNNIFPGVSNSPDTLLLND